MLCGPNRPPFSQKFLYGAPLGGIGTGNSEISRGRAGFRLSIRPAKLSASLQRSAIASEFTYSKLRSHSGRTECSEGAPAALKGGLKLSLPMSFGLAASLMSRFTTAGEYAIDA